MYSTRKLTRKLQISMRAAIDIVIYEILYDSRELYTKLKQKWNHPNLRAVVEVSAMSYPSAYITSSMLFFRCNFTQRSDYCNRRSYRHRSLTEKFRQLSRTIEHSFISELPTDRSSITIASTITIVSTLNSCIRKIVHIFPSRTDRSDG